MSVYTQIGQDLVSRDDSELQDFVSRFASELGRRERLEACLLYLKGLMQPRPRNSICAIASGRNANARALNQFVNNSPWDHEKILRKVRHWVCARGTNHPAVLVLDDCVVTKRGNHSIGIARHPNIWPWERAVGSQYKSLPRSALGQLILKWYWVNQAGQVPVSARLFLPPRWISNSVQLDALAVPLRERRWRWRSDFALDLLLEIQPELPPFSAIMFDMRYSGHFQFIADLERRKIPYVAQVSLDDLPMFPTRICPIPTRQCPPKQAWWGRQSHYLDWLGQIGEIPRKWLPLDFGSKDGPSHCLFAEHLETMPLIEHCRYYARYRWLIIVRNVKNTSRDSANNWNYYFSNLPVNTRLTEFADLIQYYWRATAMHYELWTRLGTDHYEGRSWRGLHHHIVLSLMAEMYLQGISL